MAFAGTYNITINTPMGAQNGTLTLAEDGSNLTGTMSAMDDTTEIKNGAVNGDTATWDADVTKPMPVTLNFTGQKDGDKLAGNVKLGAFGEFPFEAVPA